MKYQKPIFLTGILLLMVVQYSYLQTNDYHSFAQEDEVFLQEFSIQIPTKAPVTSIAVSDGHCVALIGEELYSISPSHQLEKLTESPSNIIRLHQEGGFIWAATQNGLFRYNHPRWTKVDDQIFVDMTVHLGKIYAATRDEIYLWDGEKMETTQPSEGYYTSNITNTMEDGSQVHISPVRLGPLTKIASYSETLYMIRRGNLALFDGKKIDEDFIDWGSLPGAQRNDMIRIGNRLFVGTEKGVAVMRGAALTTLSGKNGLPVEYTTCLAPGFDNDLWIGTERGAIRMTREGEFQYFGPGMWLPDQKVYAITAGENTTYIATEKGIGVIRYHPFTLLEKSEWFEQHITDWGYKRMGFLHYLKRKNGDWIREITDNDGGHTAPYLAAMSYKYAVTRDPKAKEEAIESFNALVWLHEITDTEGFIARAIWSETGDDDSRAIGGSGGLPAKWYRSKDGKWYWKGDTSSDEVTAHFYGVTIFHDLVAEGKDKDRAKAHLERMASYIIDCGWTMHDIDGKPTRWARWNPEYLLQPYGYMDRGLNGLEALSFMRSAHTLTGNDKFFAGYKQLQEWGYHENTVRQKNTFPPEYVAPWDDDLAFMAYMTLLPYEKNPILRSVYLRSLERSWAVKRVERLPWFNFTYGALSGNDGDFQAAVQSLRERVTSGVENSYYNSHRDDLHLAPGYESLDGTLKGFSRREVFNDITGSRPTEIDGRSNSNHAKPPVDYLRDYWMGRYYGFIKPPKEENLNPNWKEIDYSKGKGAQPYNGPERPALKK